MSGNAIRLFRMTTSIIEELRCSICKVYFSSHLIFLLPDGKNACSNCSSETATDNEYRQLALETILKYGVFRCKFSKYDCSFKEMFQLIPEHEIYCEYNPVSCATLAYTSCPWEGVAKSFPCHIITDHDDHPESSKEIKLKSDESSQGMLLATAGENRIILKYCFDVPSFMLLYVAMHFGPEGEERFTFSIWKNGDIPKWEKLANDKCPIFNHALFGMENASTLKLEKFDDAEMIKIKITTKSSGNFLDIPEPLLGKSEYPCRWINCTFSDTKGTIREHEIVCSNRIYSCMFPNCTALMDKTSMVQHMKIHQCNDVLDKYEYTTSFASGHREEPVYLCCVRDNDIFLVKSFMLHTMYWLEFRPSCFENPMVYVSACFEHSHPTNSNEECKTTFGTSNGSLWIDFTEFPTCVKPTDKLAVTIKFDW